MSKWWSRIILVALALGMALTALVPAMGATVPQSGQGLEISPPVVELAAKPGQVVQVKIKLRNVTKSPLIASGQTNDFVAGGEEGEPKLLLKEGEVSGYSLKGWIANVPNLTLQPGQVQEMLINVKVPVGASPGGHYGVIRFTGRPPELEDTGVALSASIGTLVLVNVAGEVKESTKLEDLFVTRLGVRGRFFESGPLIFTERIRNDGTVHVKPTGTLEIFSLFGRKVASFKVNDPARNILPDSIRKFEQTWSKKWSFGRYRAQVNLSYGSNKTLKASTSFWVIPYRLLLLILLILVILFFIFRSAIRNYNRRIIERARRRR